MIYVSNFFDIGMFSCKKAMGLSIELVSRDVAVGYAKEAKSIVNSHVDALTLSLTLNIEIGYDRKYNTYYTNSEHVMLNDDDVVLYAKLTPAITKNTVSEVFPFRQFDVEWYVIKRHEILMEI